VFFPVLNKKVTQVTYDEKLLGFIISLSWRTLKKTYAVNCEQHPWIKEHLDMAEKIWRDYLLGARKDVLPYESYVLFMDSLPEILEFPHKFHWYAFRSVDSTLASNTRDTVFSYTHFPQFFFVSAIFPSSLYADWYETKIEKKGILKMQFEFSKEYFNNFLVSRYKLALPALDSANPHIQAQIGRAIDSNPKKFFDSKSLQFYLMESRRKRIRTVGKCLESIKTLIEVIDYAAETPELTPEQRTMAKYSGDIVANSLLRLPTNKAIVLDALLKSTVALADNQHRISKCNFETNDIKANFIVALCSRDEYNN
jgi:hypothetical protein